MRRSKGLHVAEEDFIAFKKAKTAIGHSAIVVLQIPKGTKYVVAGKGKFRAAKALVLGVQVDCGYLPAPGKVAHTYNRYGGGRFFYRVGQIVTPKEKFDENPHFQCESGIHCYWTYREAEDHGR